MKTLKFRTLTLAAVLAAGVSVGGVTAQTKTTPPPPAIEWDKKRLEKLERNVRKLERAVTQRAENGVPTIIEPDAEVVALQARIEETAGRMQDLEASLRKLNADLETTNFELNQVRTAHNEARREIDALRTRNAELESKVSAFEQAQAAAAAAAAGPVSATGQSSTDFKAAMQLMLDGEYAGAAKAFEDFIAVWPEAPETPEAWYRLAETRYVADDHAGAAAAYSKALKGWPKSKWAGDGTVKLGASLSALGRNKDACAAVAEFDKRYGASAAAAVKTRAASLKTKAKCAA